MVFGMLRFEIDLAMARSAKARMRARRSEKPADTRQNLSPKNVKTDSNHAAARGENVVDTEAEKAESKLSALLKSRRARRIAARMTKPKTRWGRLG